jgi:hypothetical protein
MHNHINSPSKEAVMLEEEGVVALLTLVVDPNTTQLLLLMHTAYSSNHSLLTPSLLRQPMAPNSHLSRAMRRRRTTTSSTSSTSSNSGNMIIVKRISNLTRTRLTTSNLRSRRPVFLRKTIIPTMLPNTISAKALMASRRPRHCSTNHNNNNPMHRLSSRLMLSRIRPMHRRKPPQRSLGQQPLPCRRQGILQAVVAVVEEEEVTTATEAVRGHNRWVLL